MFITNKKKHVFVLTPSFFSRWQGLQSSSLLTRLDSSVGAGEATVRVRVEYEPRLVRQPQSLVAREGQTVVLGCRAEASTAPQYAWVRVGEGI